MKFFDLFRNAPQAGVSPVMQAPPVPKPVCQHQYVSGIAPGKGFSADAAYCTHCGQDKQGNPGTRFWTAADADRFDRRAKARAGICQHQLTVDILPTDDEIREIEAMFPNERRSDGFHRFPERAFDYLQSMEVNLENHPALVELWQKVEAAQGESKKFDGPMMFESWNAGVGTEVAIERWEQEVRLLAIEHRNGRMAAEIIRELDKRRETAANFAALNKLTAKK